jgi:glycine C-acetyltransferase
MALEIVRSPEGEERRQKLLGIAHILREALAAEGVVCLGKPGPLVPVLLGKEGVGRLTAALCFDCGIFANLVEYPAVSVGACRLRMQLMATHTEEQARLAAEVIGWAHRVATQLLSRPTSIGASV